MNAYNTGDGGKLPKIPINKPHGRVQPSVGLLFRGITSSSARAASRHEKSSVVHGILNPLLHNSGDVDFRIAETLINRANDCHAGIGSRDGVGRAEFAEKLQQRTGHKVCRATVMRIITKGVAFVRCIASGIVHFIWRIFVKNQTSAFYFLAIDMPRHLKIQAADKAIRSAYT